MALPEAEPAGPLLSVVVPTRNEAANLVLLTRRLAEALAGFFLCRRALLDGIEFRPVGFKILLELLVCVPGLEVRDVPLRFERRHAGASKATMGQGLLYLRHLRSLFFEVEGSARRWKFALVGGSGLAVFLPLLAVLSGPGHLPALLAFLPAFALSVGWNASLNRLWTFADLRRPALWTEGASHRPQRRSNIDSTSTLLLPVVAGDRVLAVVVCQRHAPVGFGPEALATATVAVEGLVAVLAQASLGERPAERSGPVARPSES